MNDLKLFSLEAEQSVLGGLLLDNTAFVHTGSLKAEMFYTPIHRDIFGEISRMLAQYLPADVITVSEALVANGKATEDSFNYLVTLVQNTPSAANIRRYADIVKTRYGLRELFAAGQQIAEMYRESVFDLPQMQAKAMQLITAATQSHAGTSKAQNGVAIAQGLLQYLDETMCREDGQLLGFSTGLSALDKATQGLQRGDLTVIGGRPSMGKSVLAENIARHCAKQGLSVRIQSYEMSANSLAMRGAAAEYEINYGHIRQGRFTQNELDNINEYINCLSGWKIAIDTELLGIDDLATECRIMKQQTGLDVLVIDHLHLMPRAGRNEVEELGNISAACKRLARELDIHVILVVQLNRGKEKDADKRPTMSDIRGSGSIEQDANIVIFPYRPAYYDDTQNPTVAELIIAKNRDSERGTLHIGWSGEYQKFTNQADLSALPKSLNDKIDHDPYAL